MMATMRENVITRPTRSWLLRATIVCFVVGLIACGRSDLGPLELVCKDKLDFKTIAEFRRFASGLRKVDANGPEARIQSNLLKCLKERDSINALDDLIASYNKVRPCKLSEVTKLEEFAKKHLLNNKKSLVAKFFTLFGVNIGLNCKLNLLAHVKQADLEAEQLDFIYSMASPSGWNVLINEYTKKSMKFGTSGHADSHVINRIAKLVPGLSQIDHLDYLNFDHVMNENPAADWKGIERGAYELKNGALGAKVIDSLDKIIESCSSLDKFYANSLLSLAKLRELGLVVEFLNELHERNVMLHKWLAAASFCQLMARVRLLKDQQDGISIHFEILHDEKLLENRRKLYSYTAEFDEIDSRARDMVWHASVNEAMWRQKGEAMWIPGNNGLSVAMRQLKQFIKGVEQGFQQDENDREKFES